MSLSDPSPSPTSTRRPPDWRSWLALAWVVWFGLLYGKMVIEQRGGKLRSLLRPAATSSGAAIADPEARPSPPE
jgi:hypothetical protein